MCGKYTSLLLNWQNTEGRDTMWPFLTGTIKIVVKYTFGGKVSVNVHFVRQDVPTSPITNAQLLIAANAFYASYGDNWDTRASNEWRVTEIEATDYSREGGGQVVSDETFPIVGILASASIPSSNASVVTQRTARTGRSYRGRNYVPGLSFGTVTANELNADLITDLGLLYADIRTALALADMTHVVYSLYNQGTQRVTPEATPITGTVVNSRVDTQRRRLPLTV